jgi:DNA-binding NtrC family response regulator
MLKKNGTLIVFDQDPELLRIMGVALALLGYRVVNSARIRDTLQKIDRQKFAGIIISIDSAEPLDQVLVSLNQNDSLNKNTPLFVLCNSLETKAEKSLTLPIKKVLSKPFLIKDLCSVVYSAI